MCVLLGSNRERERLRREAGLVEDEEADAGPRQAGTCAVALAMAAISAAATGSTAKASVGTSGQTEAAAEGDALVIGSSTAHENGASTSPGTSHAGAKEEGSGQEEAAKHMWVAEGKLVCKCKRADIKGMVLCCASKAHGRACGHIAVVPARSS